MPAIINSLAPLDEAGVESHLHRSGSKTTNVMEFSNFSQQLGMSGIFCRK